MEEYLRLLNLDPNVQRTPEQLAKEATESWNKLRKIYHPDKGGDPDLFIKAHHAYKMLTDGEYSTEENKGPRGPDLLAQFRIPVSFEIGFFGRRVQIAYNQLVFADDSTVVNMVQHDDKSMGIIKVDSNQKSVYIDVPAGVLDHYAVEVIGAGHKNLKGETGKALFTFQVHPHHRYRMDEQGVINTKEQVPLDIMLKGGTLKIVTLFGVREIKIKPGTMPGTKIAIPKCGLRRQADHVCHIEPLYPSQQELKTKPEWQDLKIKWDEPVKPAIKTSFDEEDEEMVSMFQQSSRLFRQGWK